MKAVGYKTSRPVTDAQSLMDIELPQPKATGRDLLIKVKAIAVNPVDTKIRKNVAPENDEYKVIGWDAVGEVVAVGEAVSQFKVGDSVYYAGDLTRQGCNAEYQLVDERIVGFKPTSLSDTEAAAIPLTAITAWELLFEHLAIALKRSQADAQKYEQKGAQTNEVILVVGAAGGVGSILIQIAKALTHATIIATASRELSQNWVKQLGADYVVDHTQPLKPQIEVLNIKPVTHIASLNGTDRYIDSYVDILAPMGKIGLIDDPEPFDIKKLKRKSLSLHWTFMYTRSLFQTEDMNAQSQLLNQVASLIDQGLIKTTLNQNLGQINAANLKAAHAEIEAGRTIGKIVLAGF